MKLFNYLIESSNVYEKNMNQILLSQRKTLPPSSPPRSASVSSFLPLGGRPKISGIVQSGPGTPLTWLGLSELLTWIADMGICSSCTNPLSLMDDFNLFNFCPACEKTESLVGRGWEIEVAGHELSGG